MDASPTNATVRGQRVPPAVAPKAGLLLVPHQGAFALGLLWLVLTNLVALTIPRLINMAVETASTGAGAITWLVVALVGLAIMGAVVRTASRVALFNVGRAIERDLRGAMFQRLSLLSPHFYGEQSTGDLMSRMTNDLTNVRLLFGFALLNAINTLIVVLTTIPLLVAIDPTTAFFSLLPFPVVILVSRFASKALFSRTKRNQEALSKVTSTVQESLAGLPLIRAFAEEDAAKKRFAKTSNELFEAGMALAKVRLLMGPLITLMGTAALAVALYVGGRAVVAGRISVGDVVEFQSRLLQLTWPTIALGFVFSVWQRGKASLQRLELICLAIPDIVDGPHQAPLKGHIRARNLSHRIGERAVLSDVDFILQPGQTLGVVGRNGSGKSMIVRLLSRQLKVAPGQLHIDDVDANQWSLSSLAKGIAVVPEEAFLFSTTLRENLCFARDEVGDEELTAMLRLVDLERDVGIFPEGLQTMIGERGITLSGGQRQRVALARALLAKPRLLILDDCLSAVDAETEQNILSALKTLQQTPDAPGVVVVSHRLSAVREATEIIALADGKVVERGTHQGLLASGGLYSTLWGEAETAERLRRQLAGAA
jgi:ATP-binding cassette, subfamily B, multidrug efflux pump